MFVKKYVTTICIDKERVGSDYKNLKTLRMVLGCYILGEVCLLEFPQTVHFHGASGEVIPAVILLNLFLSIPVTFTFLGISQYSNRGWTKMWDAQPSWRGVSIAGIIALYISIALNFFLCNKFLYYAVRSLETQIPWSKCPTNQTFLHSACYTFRENRSIYLDCEDMHGAKHCESIPWKNCARYFFEYHIQASDKRGTYYNNILIPYQLSVNLLIYIFIRNGSKTVGMFAPFLLVFPTFLHGLILIRSFLHPGAMRGLKELFNFKFLNLFSLRFWIDFMVINLYSTGFAYGGLSHLGKYYNFRNPTKVDAIFVNVGLTTYSILYSVLLYNMYGILSYEMNIPMSRIIDFKDQHIFIQFALSFSYLHPVKFWTFIFYIANFLVIFRTLGVKTEIFIGNFFELYPNLIHYMIPCTVLFCLVNLSCFLIMNIKAVEDNISKFNIMMSYGVFPNIALFFHIGISMFYGVMRLVDDMHFMLGFRPTTHMKLNWYLSPIIFFLFAMWTTQYLLRIDWMRAKSQIIISFVTSTSISLIPPLYFIIFIIVKRRNNVPYSEIFHSSKQWGPRDELLRKSREMFSAHDMTKEYLYRQKKLRAKGGKSLHTLDKSSSSI